ncbi:molybdenum cofactor guanylyltransferase [Altererythrobacter sp. SALINAS58]|nr:molybdenum cofactor guanylyltransferase [Alteripontixanthobacter muriae]
MPQAAQDNPSILGVVLAGGTSRRFGTDKAQAQLAGRTLLVRAIASLRRMVPAVVVAGQGRGIADPLPREGVPHGVVIVPDWPRPGMGPLGGIAGALLHARKHDYVAILTIGVDTPGLPDDLPRLLAPGPACFAALPIIGLWPVATLPAIRTLLQSGGSLAVRAFADAVDARRVTGGEDFANINTPQELARFQNDLPGGTGD